ncbi:hypothetical protein GCM10010468_06540 [Actinocorallia longicatena]|uniref:Uncharacterized protein n=2 Tax=Actinocorallia longicatena TaxID=111803 RepID=A0ABP6PYF6_9ACTN
MTALPSGPPPTTPSPSATPGPGETPRPSKSGKTPRPSTPPQTRRPVPSGVAKSYKTIGGRATLIIGASSASVFSAYPNEGYQVRTTTNTYELRVDFITATAKSSSVIVTWYQHPPEVQLFEYRQEL